MVNYDILSAAVTLLAGFLIFLTLGWRYPAIYGKWNKGKITRVYGKIGWLLFLTVLMTIISAGFSLLASIDILSEFSQLIEAAAAIFFILSLGFLAAFTWNILQESPSSNTKESS
jgi:hypothetical protein